MVRNDRELHRMMEESFGQNPAIVTAAQPKRVWPADPYDGAWLMCRMAHALLTGPGAATFMRPGALGGVTLDAKQIMETAETLALDAMQRSYDLGKAGGHE